MLINGERVRQAREFKGMTQTALARCAGVSQAAIAQIEGTAFISSDVLAASIAKCTSFPLQFFQQGDPLNINPGSLQFRAHACMGKRELAEGHRHAQVMLEVFFKLLRSGSPIPVRIPQSSASSPIATARAMRRSLGLESSTPVPHLLNILEWHGVVALVIPDVPSRDAFSFWYEKFPVMALSANRSGDRARLSVAHELGHLVLHHGKSRLEVDEHEADDFAAEFLMPEASMLEEIKTPVTLSSLAALKPRWRVSIQALIYRAKELEIITQRQYRYLFEQLSTVGWRRNEPVTIQPEKPRAFRQLAEFVYGDPPDVRKMSDELLVDSALMRDVLNKYAPKAEDRHGDPHSSKVVSLRRRA